MRTLVLFALGWCCLLAPASAQDWARKMFTVTSHDFGTVAKAAKTEFRFAVKNVFVEDVVITGVRSSCGCTTPVLVARGESKSQPTLTLKTYEIGEVLAIFNTHIMSGYKRATLTVSISKPYPAEVLLTVQGNIITDITVTPTYVDLSTVSQGEAIEKSIVVTRTGPRDWRINDVRCANTNFEVEVLEKARTLNSASYELKVRLKETAPACSINDQLVLITNDDRMPQFPIQVQGEVRPELSITPNLWMAGSLQPGEELKKSLVIRNNNKKPFKITRIDVDDAVLRFADPSTDAKPLHVLPITLVAGNEPGRAEAKLRIETDLGTALQPELVVQYLVRGVPKKPENNLTGNTDGADAKTEVNTAKPSTGGPIQNNKNLGTIGSVMQKQVTEVNPTPAVVNVAAQPPLPSNSLPSTALPLPGDNQTTGGAGNIAPAARPIGNTAANNPPANSTPPRRPFFRARP